MNFSDWGTNEDRKRLNTWGGVGYYRIVKPSQQIKDHEVKLVGKEILHFGNSIDEQWDNVFKEYDVFWTSYFADERAAVAVFAYAQKHGKKVVIDLDDNYFDIPETNLLYNQFKRGKRDRAILSTVLSLADAITVSTEPLRDRVKDHIKRVHGIDKPIYIIPNFNDQKDWDYIPKEKSEDRFVIGYAGSNSHLDDLEMVLPSIKEIMGKHKNVWFEMVGIISIDKIKQYLGGFTDDMLNRIAIVGATSTFNEFPEWLSQQPWNVGIAPLVDTPFTRSKSHIKWMEYSMFRIPTIASRVYPYFMELAGRNTIEDGVTGFTVKDNEWVSTIEKLIEKPELGREIGNNAYNAILKNWQYKDSKINDTVNEMISAWSKD